MATTPALQPQRPFRALPALRAVITGLMFACSASVFADDFDAIQKLIRQGDTAPAIERLDARLRDTPGDTQARFLKGVALAEAGRSDEAIVVFTKLTEDHPELPEPYNNLAVLYARQNLYERARLALELAVQAHPSYAVAWENLGDLQIKLASQSYEKAGTLDTGNRRVARKLALTGELLAAPAKPVVAKPAPAGAAPRQ